MKIPTLILIAFIYVCPSFAQDLNPTDAELSKDVVGTWQHVSSTDYKGKTHQYQKQIQLFPDGTGICTNSVDGTQIQTSFHWNILNGSILLYVYNKRGKKINTDSQMIWDLDENSLNLSCNWESDDYGRSSLYKRASSSKAEF